MLDVEPRQPAASLAERRYDEDGAERSVEHRKVTPASNTKAQRSLGRPASILARNRNVPTAALLHMASARAARI